MNEKYPTPITDAATIACGWDTTRPVVLLEVARNLEQELAESENKASQLRDAMAGLIYSAERAAEMIVSVSDRYDIDVAIESAKAALK